MASRFTQGLKGLGRDEAPARRRAAAPQAPEAPEEGRAAPAARYRPPSRQGKKPVTGYYDPAVRQQLAILAAEEQRSRNDLIAEALNLLFRQYGKPPIAKG